MENCEMDQQEEMVVVKATSSPTPEAVESLEDEGFVSDSTLEKVAAAKKYIEDHYNRRMRHIQQRKERCFFAQPLFVDIHNVQKNKVMFCRMS